MKKLEIKLRHFEELEAIMDQEREAVSVVMVLKTSHCSNTFIFFRILQLILPFVSVIFHQIDYH